jgi:hypothetical protein
MSTEDSWQAGLKASALRHDTEELRRKVEVVLRAADLFAWVSTPRHVVYHAPMHDFRSHLPLHERGLVYVCYREPDIVAGDPATHAAHRAEVVARAATALEAHFGPRALRTTSYAGYDMVVVRPS